MRQKNPKGTVAISNAQGRIRLRWSYIGTPYSLNLSYYNKENLSIARKIAKAIELDMLNGCFNSTLTKYHQPACKIPKLRPFKS